jgi:hypothetical protein
LKVVSKTKAILYLAGIFAVGLLAGGTAGYSMGKRANFMPPRPEKMAEWAMARLRDELQLTAEQIDQIKPIVQEAAVEMEAIHSATGEQIGKAIDKCNQRIEKFLTTEQAAKLREMEQKRHEKFRKIKSEMKEKSEYSSEPYRLCQRSEKPEAAQR